MSCKTINLVDYTKSDIPYYINKYPDGHKHIVLEGCEWNKDSEINVIVRIDSMDMLFILMQIISILSHENIQINELHITYLLTARCDRRFSMGEAIDLDLIGNLLYGLDIKKYVFYDAHNIPSLFRSLTNVENRIVLPRYLHLTNYNICYPDKGALDRYRENFGFGSLVGEKHRKPDGISIDLKLFNTLDYNKPILVIDDLCDGGGTFAVLANELDEKYNQLSREIWVTHAIQKPGIELLAAKYNKVYITNSYKDWNEETLPNNVTVYNITKYV